MSDERIGDPHNRSGLGRRAFIQRMAVAGFALPAIVTVTDATGAAASCRPTTTHRPTTPRPTTTSHPTTTPAPTTTLAGPTTTAAAPTTTPAPTTTAGPA
jgi:hypothetical protein